MRLKLELLKQIFFFDIGRYEYDDSYYHWSSIGNPKTSFFEIKLTRNAPQKEIFYCINKSDLKIVYYVHKEVVFAIGADSEIQSQLLEALVEYLIEKFYDTYDESLLMTCYGDVCNIFDAFTQTVKETFENYNALDIFKIALVSCRGCNKTLPIVIKKNLVEKSNKPATPIVYVHSGHALLVYIDKQYKVRGSEIVSVSY